MTFALVGRRIDPLDADYSRFPLRNRELVRQRLHSLFEASPAGTLVCSAGCGADLLALESAGQCGWRRRVILPFDRDRFRETSVTDRPGDWGGMYEQILDEVAGAGDLVTEWLHADDKAYADANDRIVQETERIARAGGERPAAVVVWDGQSYGEADLSAAFAATARSRNWTVVQVSTLE